jgi:hypothetical protein
MSLTRPKKLALLGATCAALITVTAFSTTAIAKDSDDAALVLIGGAAGGDYAIRILTQTTAFATSSTGYVTLGTVFVPIGAGQSVLIDAEFHAETRCIGGAAVSGGCVARIQIGGGEGHPRADTDASGLVFFMDSSDNGDEGINSYEGHSLSRCRVVRNMTSSTISVAVQILVRVSSSSLNFWLDDWKLTARGHVAGTGCQP